MTRWGVDKDYVTVDHDRLQVYILHHENDNKEAVKKEHKYIRRRDLFINGCLRVR